MRIEVGLEFKMLIANFHADFEELLFIFIALMIVKTFVNFDRNELMSHDDELPWNLIGYHDVPGKTDADVMI